MRGIYERKLKEYTKELEENKDTKENIFVDQTKINLQMYYIYGFRFFKLIIFILGSSYFVGMFWYIACDLNNYNNQQRSLKDESYKFEADNFLDYYNYNNIPTNG